MGRAYEVRKASIQKTGAMKAKVYSTYAKEIYIVAKGNPDPESNDRLKRIIDKAKREQVPNDIIKRAIDKAKGNNGEDYAEVTYEGFGPGASTFIIKCLTDNVNRTVGFVRAAFKKVDKALGVTNSVAYNYDYLAFVSFIYDNEEEILDYLLSNDLEIIDIEKADREITITAHPNIINEVKSTLEKLLPTIQYTYDETGMFAKEEVILAGEELDHFNRLKNLLEEIDDVTAVYHNVNLNEK